MGARRATATAVSAVVGCVLLVAVLVTWAATIGPGDVLTGDGPATHRVTATQSSELESLSGSPTATATNPVQRHDVNPVARTIGSALLSVFLVSVVAGFVLLVGFALKSLYDEWQGRRRPPADVLQADFDVLETPRLVEEEIRRDAERQRALLLDGEPRNAIVACWHRFEVQAGEVGLRRRDWETSSEFTLRVLDLVVAGSHDVARLAALYREARFSDHPLREQDRDDALQALDALHAELRARHSVGGRP
ncbi:hypothetical protein FB382_000703 [Nocardioides ginsengisegetis]|uniref:Protein-glutamine gamma-glutamyltransferase-like C-terminal domain-containing protein n=1 Tax=Nocardioides ginsengisegetis TaxID=661491 RepID=A0A7W3IXD7_9ACTN|nr:DUF4129 domain-containing protein [Nocardioides ginsengisegetis]MBA8802412.1 hypothetical protein [Nocardioides ginsengisegetis]